MKQARVLSFQESWGDRLGIAISIICILHCALTPLVLLGFPVMAHFGETRILSADWHLLFLVIVPVFALLAFIPGWRRHRDSRVWLNSGLGFLFLAGGLAVGSVGGEHLHSKDLALPSVLEIALTIVGGILFIKAHLLNRALVGCALTGNHANCHHSHEKHQNPVLELGSKKG